MREVAALAGVSIKTVSRVVNGEAGVSEELVQRVERAAAQLDYRPNLAASNLRRASHKTETVGFVPNAGIPEDPVTGSASGGMGAYLWKHGLIREAAFTAEQGHSMGRPGIVRIEVDADGDTPTTVRVAGTAVTILTGTIEV